MAALSTAPTINDLTPCIAQQGQKIRQFYVVCNAATSSTWASGIDGITNVAWAAEDNSYQCAVTFSGSTITFTTPSGSEEGYLFVWSES